MALWHPSKYTRAQLKERRLAALEMIQVGGQTNQRLADHFGESIHTVYTWKVAVRGFLDVSQRDESWAHESHSAVASLLSVIPDLRDFVR